jgi:small-conductance mechanosensitive channel
MTWIPADWPLWLGLLVWTVVTVGGAWLVGHALNNLVIRLIAAWIGGAEAGWPALLRQELGPRIPTWAALIGAWIAAGYWPLTVEAHTVVHRVLFVVGALSVTIAIAAIASRLTGTYGLGFAGGMAVTSLMRTVVWNLVLVLGLLIVLNGLGISIAPMLTALGIGGLAVALALQEPLANLFAGLFITLAGQIRIGDYVRTSDGVEGYVVDFSWRATRIRMLANNLVLVPNAKLAQSIVTNFHLPAQDLAVLVDVGVDYGSDLQRVERVTIEVAREVMAEVTGGVPDFQPFIRFNTFADSSVNFTVILRGREFVDQFLIKHEFIKRLHARYEREGIVIPFPQRTLSTREPLLVAGVAGHASPTASPSEERPQGR